MLELSKFLLLQTASPDAIIRTKESSLNEKERSMIRDIYFSLQHHMSVEDFLDYHLQEEKAGNAGQLLMQVY